ncbi:MAG TPA: hypothetical protein VHJ54_02290 [Solirubrobacterales bacterium]|nr:hypothetical protein [Solirubrobacterales bacterium]
MAQHRPTTCPEHACQPVTRLRERLVAHRVHTAVDPVEAASAKPVLNRASLEAEVRELSSGEDAMLSGGQLGDREIRSIPTRAGLTVHVMVNPAFVADALALAQLG